MNFICDESKPEERLAWLLCQIIDDDAPLQWRKHIWVAECLISNGVIAPPSKAQEQGE